MELKYVIMYVTVPGHSNFKLYIYFSKDINLKQENDWIKIKYHC